MSSRVASCPRYASLTAKTFLSISGIYCFNELDQYEFYYHFNNSLIRIFNLRNNTFLIIIFSSKFRYYYCNNNTLEKDEQRILLFVQKFITVLPRAINNLYGFFLFFQLFYLKWFVFRHN